MSLGIGQFASVAFWDTSGSTPAKNTSATGSTFFVVISADGTDTPTISDTINGAASGNVWVKKASATYNGSTDSALVFECENGNGGANHVVTVTYGTTTICTALFGEITGGAVYDTSVISSNTTSMTSPAVTPTVSGALVLAAFGSKIASLTGAGATAPAVYGDGIVETADNVAGLWAYLTGASSGTAYSIAITGVSNNDNGFVTVSFKPSGGGAAALAGTPADVSSASGRLNSDFVASLADATSASGSLYPWPNGQASVTSSASGALTTAIKAAAAATSSAAASGTLTNWTSVVLAAPLYSGVGSVLDANGTWSDGAPGAGDTVYYDGTYMTIETDGEVVATSNNFSALCQWDNGGSWSDLAVVVTPGFATYASDQSVAAAALSSAILLGSAASDLASASGRLNTQIKMSSAIADVSSATASLATAIALVASAADNTTMSAAFSGSEGAQLSGSAVSSSSASASLNTIIQMLGAAVSVVSAAGALATEIVMAGNAHVSTSAIASISTADLAAAVAAVNSAASGALTTAIRLAGPAASTVAAFAQLATQIEMAVSAGDVSVATGDLGSNTISGNASDVSSASGSLSTADYVSGIVGTASAAVGALTTAITMSVNAASVASGAGSLTTTEPISGGAVSDNELSGMLTASGAPLGLYTENPWFVVSGIRQDATSRFPVISPTEQDVLTFDFSSELLDNEELNGIVTVSVVCSAGEDADPSAVILGPASYDPTQHMVEFPVGGCPDGDDFYFTVTAPTTMPYKVLTRYGLLQSRA